MDGWGWLGGGRWGGCVLGGSGASLAWVACLVERWGRGWDWVVVGIGFAFWMLWLLCGCFSNLHSAEDGRDSSLKVYHRGLAMSSNIPDVTIASSYRRSYIPSRESEAGSCVKWQQAKAGRCKMKAMTPAPTPPTTIHKTKTPASTCTKQPPKQCPSSATSTSQI